MKQHMYICKVWSMMTVQVKLSVWKLNGQIFCRHGGWGSKNGWLPDATATAGYSPWSVCLLIHKQSRWYVRRLILHEEITLTYAIPIMIQESTFFEQVTRRGKHRSLQTESWRGRGRAREMSWTVWHMAASVSEIVGAKDRRLLSDMMINATWPAIRHDDKCHMALTIRCNYYGPIIKHWGFRVCWLIFSLTSEEIQIRRIGVNEHRESLGTALSRGLVVIYISYYKPENESGINVEILMFH